MSDIKLSPCPCCGGKGEIKERIGGYFPFYAILCDCGLRTKDMPSPEMAAEIWNKRKPIDNIIAELEKLKHDNPMVTSNYIPRKATTDILREAGGVNESNT